MLGKWVERVVGGRWKLKLANDNLSEEIKNRRKSSLQPSISEWWMRMTRLAIAGVLICISMRWFYKAFSEFNKMTTGCVNNLNRTKKMRVYTYYICLYIYVHLLRKRQLSCILWVCGHLDLSPKWICSRKSLQSWNWWLKIYLSNTISHLSFCASKPISHQSPPSFTCSWG